MVIGHYLGNPNAQLHVILHNTGGKALRVQPISLTLRSGARILELPARGFFQTLADAQAVLLTPITIKPDEEWAHILNNCFRPFDQPTERRSKDIVQRLRNNIVAKRADFTRGFARTFGQTTELRTR